MAFTQFSNILCVLDILTLIFLSRSSLKLCVNAIIKSRLDQSSLSKGLCVTHLHYIAAGSHSAVAFSDISQSWSIGCFV